MVTNGSAYWEVLALNKTLEKTLKEMMQSHSNGIYTSIPATVLEFDSTTQRAKVQIDIKQQIGDSFQMVAPLEDVGIGSMRSGGYIISFPINHGDKVRLSFAHSSIDNWLIDGSNELVDTRKHNINDALADNLIIYPLDETISDYDNDNLTLRNESNSIYLKVKQDGIDILGNVKIIGDVEITGKLTVAGVIKSLTDVLAKAISLLNHLHGGISSGGSDTARPK